MLVMLLAAFCSAYVAAQNLQEKVAVEIVNVYLSATDKSGDFVSDLRPEELILREDGIPQTITNFSSFGSTETETLGEMGIPLTVAFVMDTSESMGLAIEGAEKIDLVKNAAFRLVDELKKEDRFTLISFNEFPTEITPLTSDLKRIREDLLFQGVEGGNTALLDAIYYSIQRLNGQFGRKLMVVCSDGEDSASELRLDEVLSNLIASDITVLAFGTMSLGTSSMRGRHILKKIAEASGGYAFFPSSLKDLDEVMDRLRKAMRNQYSLGYRSSNSQAGGWREIEIESTRDGLKLRYRRGYVAGSPN